MELKKLNDRQQVNKISILCQSIILFVLTMAYFAEVMKGARTIAYFAICCAFMWVPVAVEIYLYRRKNDHTAIMRVMGYTYGAAYIFFLFTSEHILTFVYVMPMMLVLAGYNDYKFAFRTSAAIVLINIGRIIQFYMTREVTALQIVELEIQLAVTILMAIFVVVITKTNTKLTSNKLLLINKEKEQLTILLERIVKASNNVTDGIGNVSDCITELNKSVESTKCSMQEVSNGTGDTARSIQIQLTKTEEIHEQIQKVIGASTAIFDNVKYTEQAIAAGNTNVRTMIDEVNTSKTAELEVVKKMQELSDQARDMNTILDIIRKVASQTSLLALNASIEAARAGEAGRGFSVVAKEISNLSGQTQSAVSNISEMITGLTEDIGKMEDAVETLVENNNKQHSATNETAKHFELITQRSSDISVNARDLQMVTERLKTANKEIIESIQTISAVTEEVTAHAAETSDGSEKNAEIVEKLKVVVKKITTEATELKKVQSMVE